MPNKPDDEPERRKQRVQKFLQDLETQGVPQREVAARTRVPTQYLSDVKHGRRPLTELFARRLNDEFGVDYLWLLGRNPATRTPRFRVGLNTSEPKRVWLPVFPHPVEGDPQAQSVWDGTAVEVAGAPAAQAALARDPYVLRFGVDDRKSRLRTNDLVLISQAVNPDAEVQVLKLEGKAFLARDTPTGWEPLSPRRTMSSGKPLVIGHALGILWGPLAQRS